MVQLREPKTPEKFFVHYYNHFGFISELLERVDKLEQELEKLKNAS